MECGGLTPPFSYAYVLSGPWQSQGGVNPPHSKALRAFSWFPGAGQQRGMSDRFHNGLLGVELIGGLFDGFAVVVGIHFNQLAHFVEP